MTDVQAIRMDVKKVAMRQDKDGNWLMTVAIHPSDANLDIIQAHPGTVFSTAWVEDTTSK